MSQDLTLKSNMQLGGNVENECVKLPDGRTVWLSRSCAVVTAVFANVMTTGGQFSRHVLMVKRGPACPDNVGLWVLPCGYLDRNESLAQAAVRETLEETGLDLRDLPGFPKSSLAEGQPVYVSSTPGSDSKQNVVHYFTMVIPVNEELTMNTTYVLKGLPELNVQNTKVPGEVDELRWVPLQDVKSLEVAFNHIERIQFLTNKVGG